MKTWIVWAHDGGLDFEECTSKGDAFLTAYAIGEGGYRTLCCIEQPDGTIVTDDEFDAWAEERRATTKESQHPPRPPYATIAVTSPHGEPSFGDVYYENYMGHYEYLVARFGPDRVTMKVHPRVELVWRGRYKLVARVDYKQRRINESREHFGKPILQSDTTYEPRFEYDRIWTDRLGQHPSEIFMGEQIDGDHWESWGSPTRSVTETGERH